MNGDQTKKLNDVLIVKANVLDKAGLKFFLSAGTLLGLIRNKELLNWDKDVDVDFLIEDYTDEVKANLPEEIQTRPAKEGFYLTTQHDGISFDMFPLWEHNSIRYRNPVGDICSVWSKHHFEKFDEIEYIGRKWRIPTDTEGYFNTFYGSDWKEEKKTFNWIGEAKNEAKVNNVKGFEVCPDCKHIYLPKHWEEPL